MIITHNLIFEREDKAQNFIKRVEYLRPGLVGMPILKFTQYGNVLLVSNITYLLLCGMGVLH